MIQVDLHAPTIPADQRVWRLFPGDGYQFLESFLEQQLGFLDLPGLQLPDAPISEAEDLIPRVARSQDVRDAFYEHGSRFDPASLSLANYRSARRTQYRSRIAQALVSFYEVAKQGDYVVLPEPTFRQQIRVGRFASNRAVRGFYRLRYGGHPVPARSIDWLVEVPENTVSTPLSAALRHQHPFTLLERSLHVEVFSIAHGSFVYGDRHAATIYNELRDFLDADAALLGAISRLAAAAAQSDSLRE